MNDPFGHHPNLREMITEPETSNWRYVTTQKIIDQLSQGGLEIDWFHTDEDREEIRVQALADHGAQDLWIFGYGSLMWDPAIYFTDVRRARVLEHARRFILCDRKGGRGTAEAPGLMAALDVTGSIGPHCEGLAFRIAADQVEAETRVLFQREMIAPGYHPRFVTAEISTGTISALTFVADHSSDLMDAGLTRDEQVQFISTGAGILGSSYDYICNLAAQLQLLNVQDPDVTALLTEVEEYRAR